MKNREGFYTEVGGRIRAARGARGLTQQALASQLALTRATVANIEKGRQQILLHTLVDVATTLQVEISDLVVLRNDAEHDLLDELLRNRTRTQREWIEAVVSEGDRRNTATERKGR